MSDTFATIVKKKTSLFVNTFVVTVAVGCPAILLAWLWDVGQDAQEQLRAIVKSVNSNTDMLKSMEEHFIERHAESEANAKLKDENHKSEIQALKKRIAELEKKTGKSPTVQPAAKLSPGVFDKFKKEHADRLKDDIKKDYERRTEQRQMIQQTVPKAF